jgi:hypothetical protein
MACRVKPFGTEKQANNPSSRGQFSNSSSASKYELAA